MPFENNGGTLQQWHMTNTPPEINKYDTHKKQCLAEMAHLAKTAQRLFAKDWAEWFLKGNSYMIHDCMIQIRGHGILKSSFFDSRVIFQYSPESNCRGRFYKQSVGTTSLKQ